MKRSAWWAGGLALFCSVAPVGASQPVRLFILSGQSNMVGLGRGEDIPAGLRKQNRVWYDHYNAESRLTDSNYVGTSSADWGPLTAKGKDYLEFGPEITFGHDVSEAFPQEQIAIVKAACSGSNIITHWARGLPQDPDGLLWKSQLYHVLLGTLDSASYDTAHQNPLAYPQEPTRLDRALARLSQNGQPYEIGALVWMQGENEAGWRAGYQYFQLLSSLVGALRQDLGRPQLPILIGRISDNLYAPNGGPIPEEQSATITAVREAQVAFAQSDPYSAWVDTDDFEPRSDQDHWHFRSQDYLTLGHRFADAYQQVLGRSQDAGLPEADSGLADASPPDASQDAQGPEAGLDADTTTIPADEPSSSNSGGCALRPQKGAPGWLTAALALWIVGRKRQKGL